MDEFDIFGSDPVDRDAVLLEEGDFLSLARHVYRDKGYCDTMRDNAHAVLLQMRRNDEEALGFQHLSHTNGSRVEQGLQFWRWVVSFGACFTTITHTHINLSLVEQATNGCTQCRQCDRHASTRISRRPCPA